MIDPVDRYLRALDDIVVEAGLPDRAALFLAVAEDVAADVLLEPDVAQQLCRVCIENAENNTALAIPEPRHLALA